MQCCKTCNNSIYTNEGNITFDELTIESFAGGMNKLIGSVINRVTITV